MRLSIARYRRPHGLMFSRYWNKLRSQVRCLSGITLLLFTRLERVSANRNEESAPHISSPPILSSNWLMRKSISPIRYCLVINTCCESALPLMSV